MRFDVCVPTKNSSKTIVKMMKSVIDVFGEKINKFIIVDGYSKDKTIDLVKNISMETGKTVEVYLSNKKLGKVREFMIKKVETSWFFFIDSDIVVNKKWFNALVKNIDEKTGAIHGFGLPPTLISELRKVQLFAKLKIGLQQRGFTSNTLLNKNAVTGIKIPNIGRLEDVFIQKEILRRGYKWKIVPVFCLHLKRENKVIKEALSDLFLMMKSKGPFSFLEL